MGALVSAGARVSVGALALVGGNASVGALVACVVGARVGATRSVRVFTTGISVRNAGAATDGAAVGCDVAGVVSALHALAKRMHARTINNWYFIFDSTDL